MVWNVRTILDEVLAGRIVINNAIETIEKEYNGDKLKCFRIAKYYGYDKIIQKYGNMKPFEFDNFIVEFEKLNLWED